MKYSTRKLASLTVLASCIGTLNAQVVINEFQYDDTGASDDREFIELYNSGPLGVDIGNWLVGGRDAEGDNASILIPDGTILAPGAFWVIGNSLVPNVNQVIDSGFLENDIETIELTNASAVLVDAVLYEGNKATIPLSLELTAQITSPYWGNHQGIDIGATGTTLTSVGRFIDGRDTNNNGRDFGLRPGTPGISNQGAGGFMTSYEAPNVDAFGDGATVAGTVGSFVSPRVFTPGIATAGLNPNPIPAPLGVSKAIIAWDQSGGGNGSISEAVFANGGSFQLQVYLDTNNLPVGANSNGLRGTEETFYGVGSIDGFTNLSDVSGVIGTGASANGATGVHWYYEKVGESGDGLGDVSEKLYLIDANDGGDSNINGLFDWTILATIDLSAIDSAWHNLSLSIAPNGDGVAAFDNQVFTFTTIADLVGEFSVGYREFVTEPGVGVPSYLRPPTYAMAIPEPGSLGLLAVATSVLGVRSRRNRKP